jgi:hypothetical protein
LTGTRAIGSHVTTLGAAYGIAASLVFPVAYGVMSWGLESVQIAHTPHALSSAIHFLTPLWLVTLPGAVAAGVALAHLVSRRSIRHVVAAGATGIALALGNAGLGGVINVVAGNPCGLGGPAAHSLVGGFVGGLLGFLFFSVITVPTALGVGIVLRDHVLALHERSGDGL